MYLVILFVVGAVGSAIPAKRTGITADDVVNKATVEEFDTALTIDDFVSGEQLVEENLVALGIKVKPDPTIGKYAEGDIALSTKQLREFIQNSNQRARNAIRGSWRRWPNGEVPYTVSSQYGRYSRSVIAGAMTQYHKKTCIRFVERDPKKHRDYIYIVPDDGCYSLVGRVGSRQPVSLIDGCIQTGTVIHELMHAIGFFHEQSRADRDENILIEWKNIIPNATEQFDKYSLRVITHLGAKYDYGSIMHYGPYAFSRNGEKTIKPKKDDGEEMGQRRGFSTIDLEKINSLYSCDGVNGGGDKVEIPSEGKFECKDTDWRCVFYRLDVFGYCSDGPEGDDEIRYKICPKSCGVCDELRPVQKTTTATTTQEPPSTTEQRRKETTTEATTTKVTQAVIKPKTVTVSCKDSNKACNKWKRSGHCTLAGYRSFMKDTCPSACDLCPEAGNKKTCKDDVKLTTTCSISKMLGRCSTPGSKKYCQKTCGHCK